MIIFCIVECNYNVNLDGELDVNDAIILLKFLVHIIDAITYTES
mgnify:FL=1